MATKVERHLLRINADRSINVETDIPIVAGSIGVDEVLITFEEPEDWQDMSLTVTMVSSVVDTPYTVLWDGVSAFNVPWELTQEVGVIGFSVLGISSSSQTYQRGLTQSSVGLITIVTPGINVGEPPVEPTPSAYERVLAMIESLPEVENRAEAVINDLDNAFRGVAQYLPAGMGNVVTAELDGTDSELVSVSDAFKNGKLLGAKVYGKSTQVVTTGKNLLDANNLVWLPGVRDDDGNADTSQAGNAHYTNEIAVFPNTEYTLSGTLRTPNSVYRLYYLNSNKEWISRTSGLSSDYHTFVAPSNCGFIQIQVSNTILLSDAQLELGSTATDYEPYTGGIASPNPDYPQEIKSVVEGDLKLTGKCIWGGEQMADDIVTAVNNQTYSRKGEDSTGKYVLLSASSAISSKVFFEKFEPDKSYTFVVISRKGNTSPRMNMGVKYLDGHYATLNITDSDSVTADTVYMYAINLGNAVDYLFGSWNAGSTYIYYEKSGVFEGTLTVDDFTPYEGDSLHFLPDDVEPLRSLPDGTRDVLTIDANGNGVIERNVKKVELKNLSAEMWSVLSISGTDVKYLRASFSDRKTYSNNVGDSGNASFYMPSVSYNLATNSADIGNGARFNWGQYSFYFYLQLKNVSTVAQFAEWCDTHDSSLCYALATPVTEIIPASRMPKVPSQYLHAWLEAKDQNGEEIVTDYSVYYEKSIGALLSQIEQALDAAGYPITDYEPENAMSVAPVLSNDANPVTDAQMAAAVTYGFTLN